MTKKTKKIPEVTYMPKYYIIEPTNQCNYSCFMCPNSLYRESQKGSMDINLFRNIIGEITNDAIYVQLYWMGEPFINNRIFQMLDVMKDYSHIKTIISTNASLLDKNTAKSLVSSCLDTLIISLDAISSPELYTSIRRGGNLENVLDNIKYFLDLNTKIDVIIQTISFKSNKNEYDNIEHYFEKYNCRFKLEWLDTWANQFPSLKRYSDFLSPNISSKRMPCADLWYKATIHWNGLVSICCHDWNFTETIGDLNTSSMRDIWNSPKLRKYRNIHLDKKFRKIKLCSKCVEWATVEEYSSAFE